jgi:hypothetical protein
MSSLIMCLGRVSILLLEVRTYPKVLKVDENWVFPSLSILIRTGGYLYKATGEIRQSFSCTGGHPRQAVVYILDKIRTNRDINEQMASMYHC